LSFAISSRSRCAPTRILASGLPMESSGSGFAVSGLTVGISTSV
jgi:hypothetical protein